MNFILIGQYRLSVVDRPVDPNVRIVPRDTDVVIAPLTISHFVDNLGFGSERAKSMRNTYRHEQLLPVFRGKLGADLLAIGR